MNTALGALFVFAHQDDEMAAVSRIAYELTRGATIYCAFLTDGSRHVSSEIRDRESVEVLTLLGVARSSIHFIGSQIPIRDTTLVEHLELALEQIKARLDGREIEVVYSLAWEGGHPDHDASLLVAAAFAQSRGILDRCYELPLYHGSGTAGPLFRVLAPLTRRDAWESRRLTFEEGLKFSLLAWRYGSQFISWIGLFPEAFLKLAIFRRELVRRVDISRFRHRPHEGALLYERYVRLPYEQFAREAAPFVERHFPREERPENRGAR